MEAAVKGFANSPVRPRRSCLGTHKEVMDLVKHMVWLEGFKVEHDKDAGTIVAFLGETCIYKAMQKGAGNAPWIVTYSTEYFGGGEA